MNRMIRTSEPVFAVRDVRATIAYYRTILGFESEWLWGEPPTFGGTRWGQVQVMFCQQQALQAHIEGHQHFFRSDDVQSLYDRHKASGANIIEDIENKPWGVREYIVRDPNGYHLRFAGPEKYERPATALDSLPSNIRIEPRLATVDEYIALTSSVKWNVDPQRMPQALANSLLGVVAIDTRTNQTVGMARACGDGRYFTIWDVIVDPPYQKQRIGTAMMEATLAELRRVGPKGAYVGLFAAKPGFYEKLGFVWASGMHMAL
jgi:uncharacterized glyoxalase superfamily protein PhnB/ribosomal protein S18 acetylase RimI-like enzyme